MSDLHRVQRAAPDCWEIVAADHHPDPALRGVVLDVVCELADVPGALTQIARGVRARVVT